MGLGERLGSILDQEELDRSIPCVHTRADARRYSAEADDSSDDNDTGHSPHQDDGPTRAGNRLVSTSA
jgi:hypothetical protein